MEPRSRKFIMTKKLGAGAFGEIYQGIDVKTKEEVAIKVEKADTRVPQLFYEAKLYQYFHQEEGALENGIPRVYYWMPDGDNNIMVMDLLGPSLEDLFNFCNRKLSLKTTLMLGEQMLARVEYVHSRRLLHRDLKPDNFVVGRGRHQSRVYIIDFGLAKKYITREGVHIPYKDGKSLTGTARYASINTHNGIEQARRDDLESLAYILLYFLRGSLPWQNMRAANKKEKYQKILEMKVSTSVETLCKGQPPELAEFLNYAKSLRFEEKPDYARLKGLIRRCAERLTIRFDNIFDWTQQHERKPLKDQPHTPTPLLLEKEKGTAEGEKNVSTLAQESLKVHPSKNGGGEYDPRDQNKQ
eukprot:TRINITY_DN1074_c0_g2_i1.p1 TRINITY_DN1074_c0_g2~~TRINITY_DN1074_c0_g2_i1.p1  ORF type:complete len:356 (+),score=68.94 TRINITY_DN1074_c0_g2_i1:51-1118(+)